MLKYYKGDMEIGGYLNFELGEKSNHLHEDAFACNTGRNALEYILLNLNVKKIYIPYFTCDAILETIRKLSLSYEWYHVDKQLNIDFASTTVLAKDEYLLYTNYFGVKNSYVRQLCIQYNDHIIIDNAQALFHSPVENVPTFYSPRKFLGIPDGGYAYLDSRPMNIDCYERDYSFSRCGHLLKRLEMKASEGYSDFKENSKALASQPIRAMSALTERIISSIDTTEVQSKRIDNYKYLHSSLHTFNCLELEVEEVTPLVYPLLIEDRKLRSYLISNKIYVATYWPNVFTWCDDDSIECYLSENIIPLPIDQRYGLKEMDRILSVLIKGINNGRV